LNGKTNPVGGVAHAISQGTVPTFGVAQGVEQRLMPVTIITMSVVWVGLFAAIQYWTLLGAANPRIGG